MSRFTRMLLAAVPTALMFNLCWIGVLVFLNGFVDRVLGRSVKAWTTLTIFYTAALAGWQLLCPEISARISRRWTVVLAMAVSGGAYPLAGYCREIAAAIRSLSPALAWMDPMIVLGAAVILMAMMVGVAITVWSPMVAAAGGSRPGRAIALYRVVEITVGVAGILGASKLIGREGADMASRYRDVFLMIGGAAVVSMGYFAVISRGLEPPEEPSGMSLSRLKRADIRELLHGAFLPIVLLGFALEPFAFHTVNQLYRNLAAADYHVDEGTIGTVMAVSRLAGVVALLILSPRADRLRPTRIYGLGMLLVSAVVFCMPMAPSGTFLLAMMGVYFLGIGVVWSSNITSLNASVPARLRDPAFALMGLSLLGATGLAGVFHNVLARSGVGVEGIFHISPIVTAIGGTALIVRSFLVRPHKDLARLADDAAGQPASGLETPLE